MQYKNGKCLTHGHPYPCSMECHPQEGDELTAAVEAPRIVNGYDATFWYESYAMVRDAVIENLARFVHDNDVAEEAIIVEAIEAAGKHANGGAALPPQTGNPAQKSTLCFHTYPCPACGEELGQILRGVYTFTKPHPLRLADSEYARLSRDVEEGRAGEQVGAPQTGNPQRKVEAQLEHLAQLPGNWDSYGAPPITREALEAARTWLKRLYVWPRSNGGLQLGWDEMGQDVHIAPDGTFEYDDEGNL